MPELGRRYDASAEQYHRYRPSYPAALIDWILSTTSRKLPARVADVGCGTGIATRLFAERGFATVGVDLSQRMLVFAQGSGLASYVRAQASATALASGSIDLVVAAQCFHWFDPGITLAEFRRILRPDGWCAAFWNLRAAAPLADDYDQLLRTHTRGSEYTILLKQEAAPAALRATPGVVRCHEIEFANQQTLDLDGLLGRAYSSSCVQHGLEDPAAFEQALAATFSRYAQAGTVTFPYRTVAICWQLAD